MRIALCQIDPTVGDLAGNAAKILAYAQRAAAAGADLVAFPELSLIGYPPRDLIDRPSLVTDAERTLEALRGALPSGPTYLVGTVRHVPASNRPSLTNAVMVLRDGHLVGVAEKRLLPTYDVFDDQRYFARGERSLTFELCGQRVGVTICEDIWSDRGALSVRRYRENPVADLVSDQADVLINVAASPFTLAKREGRAALLAEVARTHRKHVLMVNQVGGNDDILFDGASAYFDPDGNLRARAKSFDEDLLVVTLGGDGTIAPVATNEPAAALDALALGVRDYVHKTGFSRVVLGLSGGIDSALVAAIAARALGPENVLGFALPSRYSSEHSRSDAGELAAALGIGFREVPIETMYASYLEAIGPLLHALGPAPENDVTFENIQARIRGNVLMAVANRTGSLLLTTGNKSELAVGYCTLYGDMAGALAVIADLPKCKVYDAAREVNRQAGRAIIPESTLTKPPSAELRPDQTDQDSLPPYEVLDAVLELYVEDHVGVEAIVERGFDEATVQRIVRLVKISEYKRRQMAPGLIITSKAFGSGRRYPIAQRYLG